MRWALVLAVLAALDSGGDVGREPLGPSTPPSRKAVTAVSSVSLPKPDRDFACSETHACVPGLTWLARHQNQDGSWSVTGYANRCRGEKKCLPNVGSDELTIGVTGLALFAFLGAGYHHLSKDTHVGICYGDVVKKALQYLIKVQNPDGSFGDKDLPRSAFNSALATLALCEAYGLTGSRIVQDPAQKAVEYLVSRADAWGETQPDAVVTGWAALALHSAKLAELNIREQDKVFGRIRDFFESLTDPKTGRVGYRRRGRDAAVIANRNGNFRALPTCTAISVIASAIVDREYRTTEQARVQLELLAQPLGGPAANVRDMHHWFWWGLATWYLDGPTGPFWRKWRDAAKRCVLNACLSDKDLCAYGSWDSKDKWACEGGRVYVVAAATLAVEVYYRYPLLNGIK